MRLPVLASPVLLALSALGLDLVRAQPIVWDGGAAGTGNSLSVVTNWNPDLASSADLTDQILRIATANFDVSTVTTSFGIGNILIGTPPAIAGFEFDNAGGYYRLNFGVRLVPTTSTSLVTDRVLTFSTPGTIVQATNQAAASIRRFATNVGDGSGDIATVIVNLAYEGSGTIQVDATSSFLFQEIKITGTGGITKTGPGTLTLDSGRFTSLSNPINLDANPQYAGSLADSYSGGLTILEGMVSLDSVNRLPSATLNGDGVTPNPDAVVINGGTLRFTGGTIGSSANRGFRVGAATGTLDITAANTRLLGSIRNVPGEDGVLIKTGPGNLSLAGANHTYSGGTRLEAGTLTLNGITLGATEGVGLLTSAGSTLRGHGTVSGPSALASGTVVQPGTYTDNVLTAPVGALTFDGGVALGALALAYDLDTPAASDLIAANSSLDLGEGTLDLTSFTFTAGPGYGPGLYPLIVSDTPLLGTLGPVTTGTLADQDLTLFISADRRAVLLQVGAPTASALETWRELYFDQAENSGLAADDADPDGDGLPNLLEYALGTDPTVSGADAPESGVSDGYLTLTFSRIADPALVYTVRATSDLVAGLWAPVWTSTSGENLAGSVTVSDVEPLASHPRRFLRLHVDYAGAGGE